MIICITVPQPLDLSRLPKQEPKYTTKPPLFSDGSLILGLETTFAGHKGCHPFCEIPRFDAAKISLISEHSNFFETFLLKKHEIGAYIGFYLNFCNVQT